jgi:glycosyltransferase involved in cell wall biosynthesis
MHVSSLRPLIELIEGRDDVQLTITTAQKREYLSSIGIYGSPNVMLEHFPGEDSFVRRMQIADGCVVCLAWEGHSPEDVSVALATRAVEALRFGKPLFVVAPEDSFLFRFVRKEGVGIAVSPGVPGEIRAALDTFLDPVRRDGFACNVRRLFDGMFSTKHVGPLWVGLVRNLAGARSSPFEKR